MVEALKLDDTGDIDFDNSVGVINTTSGADALAQKLWILMNTNNGEMEWNPDIGMNQIEVRINSDDKQELESMINAYLNDMLGEQYVSVNVDTIDVDKGKRINHVACSVTLNVDGEQQVVEISMGGD